MEIRLDTEPLDPEREPFIQDEYGYLWELSPPSDIDGMRLAATKGLDNEEIHGYYKNGVLFIMYPGDAERYFVAIDYEGKPTRNA